MNKIIITLLFFCTYLHYLEAKQTKYVYFEENRTNTVLTGNKPDQTSQVRLALRKTEEMRKAAEVRVGEFLKKRYCIDNNLISSYSKEQTAAYTAHFGPKIKELGERTEALNDLVRKGPQKKDMKELTLYQKKLTSLIKELDTGFNEICETEKTLCGCYGS